MVGLSRLVTNAGYMQHFLSSLGLLGLLNLLRIKLQVSIQERQHLAISRGITAFFLHGLIFIKSEGPTQSLPRKPLTTRPDATDRTCPEKGHERNNEAAVFCSSVVEAVSGWFTMNDPPESKYATVFKIFKINPRH